MNLYRKLIKFFSLVLGILILLVLTFQNCSKFSVIDLSSKTKVSNEDPNSKFPEEVISSPTPLPETLEDPVLPIKVGSYFSKTQAENGFEIVATLYSESLNQEENFSHCVNSKIIDSENDNSQFWDLGNYSSCDQNHQPQCLKGSRRITSAMSFNSKIGKLQRYFACIIPSQKTATVTYATVYKHFDSQLKKWTCVSSSGSENYWDLGGYSRCSSTQQVECLNGTRPFITSLVHLTDGISKYSVACVKTGQNKGSKVVASLASGTINKCVG